MTASGVRRGKGVLSSGCKALSFLKTLSAAETLVFSTEAG